MTKSQFYMILSAIYMVAGVSAEATYLSTACYLVSILCSGFSIMILYKGNK